jgi:hypothetical protein
MYKRYDSLSLVDFSVLKIKYLPLPIEVELAFDPEWSESYVYILEDLKILKAPYLNSTINKNGWYLINKLCFYCVGGIYYTTSVEKFKDQLKLYDFKLLSYDTLESLYFLLKNNKLPLHLKKEILNTIELDYNAKYYFNSGIWYLYQEKKHFST